MRKISFSDARSVAQILSHGINSEGYLCYKNQWQRCIAKYISYIIDMHHVILSYFTKIATPRSRIVLSWTNIKAIRIN